MLLMRLIKVVLHSFPNTQPELTLPYSQSPVRFGRALRICIRTFPIVAQKHCDEDELLVYEQCCSSFSRYEVKETCLCIAENRTSKRGVLRKTQRDSSKYCDKCVSAGVFVWMDWYEWSRDWLPGQYCSRSFEWSKLQWMLIAQTNGNRVVRVGRLVYHRPMNCVSISQQLRWKRYNENEQDLCWFIVCTYHGFNYYLQTVLNTN